MFTTIQSLHTVLTAMPDLKRNGLMAQLMSSSVLPPFKVYTLSLQLCLTSKEMAFCSLRVIIYAYVLCLMANLCIMDCSKKAFFFLSKLEVKLMGHGPGPYKVVQIHVPKHSPIFIQIMPL